MLRFTILAAVVVFASSEPQNNFIFKNDITPEEAQAYLKQLPFTEPKLAGRTAVLPLVRYDDPRFRSAEAGPSLGHYWKNGQEIQNTEDYLEEVYNAAQYHGQDGLGQYAYGYETPESSKVENREGSGVVSGSYVYKVPGQKDLIKVRYFADSQGFHQEDNLPKVELKPAEETPELRAARLAFEKAWNEAAAANSRAPSAEELNNFQQYGNYQGQASEPQAVVAAAPGESQPRDGKALAFAQAQSYQGNQQQSQYNQPQQYNQQQQQQYNQQQQQQYNQQQQQQYNQQQQQNQQYNQEQQYNQQQSYSGQQQQQKQAGSDGEYVEPEPTGPPHGFFYSFTYPVGVIVPKNELEQGYQVDHDTVGVSGQ